MSFIHRVIAWVRGVLPWNVPIFPEGLEAPSFAGDPDDDILEALEVLEPVEPMPEKIEEAELEPEPETPRRKYKRGEKEHFGAHYYLGDLLDQMGEMFRMFRAMKKVDPDGYAMFRQVGCRVMSSDMLHAVDVIEPFFITVGMPMQSCVYMPEVEAEEDDPESGSLPHFVHIQKVKRPVNVQWSPFTVYACTIVAIGKRGPLAAQVHISVDEKGATRLLKECRPVYRKPGFTRMEWGYPWLATELLTAHNRRNPSKRQTLEEYWRTFFVLCANEAVMHESGIVVRVRRGGEVAQFAIDMLRTPYFFADRERTVNDNGNTRRILHIVKPHMRRGKMVKAHWRGLRRFTWNGYDVSIGMPGLHHHIQATLTAPTYDERDPDLPKKDRLDAERTGRLIANALNQEVRAS